MNVRAVVFLISIITALTPSAHQAFAEDPSPAGLVPAYRTDSANPQLPWYQLRPGEFPPAGSEHRVRGQLVAVDFIHRNGQFRADDGGELVNFTLLPYSIVYYLNAEADLRDVPLGTRLEFYLYQDEKGEFTRAVVIHDGATKLTSHGLENAAIDPAEKDPAKLATEQQRKKHVAFLKQRGLAAQIDRVEGKTMTVTLFGDAASLAALCKDEKIEPQNWVHHEVKAAVANEELRTYNPPVDNQGSEVLECHQLPTDCYGCSGVQWTIKPRLLLEGFRKGHIVRLFAHYSWPIEDMPFGETLYTERPGAKMEEESANQYSYRTDYVNEDLPWYQLQAGKFPPLQSQHTIAGELVSVDAAHRRGQFHTDRTGETVDFTMPPFGTIQYLNAEAELADLPPGRRYYFSLYQDDKGSFTRAAMITDEFTRMSRETLTYRVENINVNDGTLFVATQLAPMKDDKDHVVQPPDLGHSTFTIDSSTRVWKDGHQAAMTDINAGDQLLVNLNGCTKKLVSRCTDIWIGRDTHKAVADEQRAKHKAYILQNGMPGWIESVNGKTITVAFFAGRRGDFRDIKQGEPWGQRVSVRLLNDDLQPRTDHLELMGIKDNLPEHDTAATNGSAGVRWVLEGNPLPPEYQPGTIVRVLKPEWLPPGAGK